MARTSKDPRRHYVPVRLTDSEKQALELLQSREGHRSLSDALRSLIPRLVLEPTGAPATVRAQRRK